MAIHSAQRIDTGRYLPHNLPTFYMSGAATSSGIEYQQRIASLFLLYQYAQIDIAGLVGITGEHLVSEVWFESAAPIDDLQITSRNGRLIYLNIKRSLSLSDDLESDFGSVIEQFVRAFVANPAGNAIFCLATSGESSGKILYDLRKLCEAIRLNDTGFQSNPLNKSEIDTLARYKKKFFRSISSDWPNVKLSSRIF